MGLLTQETFVCLDCETTGLDPKQDRVIEVAIATFTFSEILDSFETLIDPEAPISETSIAIHHITPDMVQGQPKMGEVLPKLIQMAGQHTVIGHGIKLDLLFLAESAERCGLGHPFSRLPSIDTLRLARLYGESETNSLEKLGEHFEVEREGARHRAMSDVRVNISVFKHLLKNFKTTEQVHERLQKPILLKKMPLGKYKGRLFNEVPIAYLRWAVRGDFDQDLMFSLKSELQKRGRGDRFEQATNPFSQL